MLNQEQFERMKDYWGFSFIHLKLEWEDLSKVPQDVKDLARLYAQSFTLNKEKLFTDFKNGIAPGIFLYSGQNGNGKTAVIHQVAKDLILGNKGIKKMRYMTGLEIFAELKKTFRSDGGMDESELLDSIITCDVFFLDDLDKIGRLSDYEKKRFTLIIDKRYTDLKPIIVTANKSIQGMVSDGQLESHIFSRLTQMCIEIELKSQEDFRMRGKLTVQPKKDRRFI